MRDPNNITVSLPSSSAESRSPVRPGQADAQDELRRALRATAPLLRRAAGFAFLSALLVLAPSGYMLEVYDRVITSRSAGTLAMLTLLLLAVLVLMEVLDWCAGSLLQHAGLQLERGLAPRLFDASLADGTRRARTASLQPLDDLKVLRDFLPGPAVRAALEAPAALLFLAVLWAMHPVLAWVALGAAALQAAIAWANERGTRPPLLAAAAAARLAQREAGSVLRNTEVVAAMGMLPALQRRWQALQDEALALQAAGSAEAGQWQAAARLVQTVLGSALLGLAAWLLLRGELGGQAGWLVVASLVGGRVLAPLATGVAHWRSVVSAREAWVRIAALLAAVPPHAPAMALPRPAGRLLAENLVVTVPGTSVPVLKGVSFALAPGEALAVVGPSAAGKTVLARTLVGLWPSAAGQARLDGADVFAWRKDELGPHIGYLPQGVELFDGTVAQNIARFGAPDAAAVEAAARQAGLHEWIAGLPQGYDTDVGADGSRFSGGQRQRIALARALYGQPALVVLDEPNASLDADGDAALAQAIRAGKAAGTTFVVMTHRTGVLAQCDRLLVLAAGQVQAFGACDEVLAALERAGADRAAAPSVRRGPQVGEVVQ